MGELLSNTLGVTCEADRVATVSSPQDAQSVVRDALEADLPLHILGGASNVVLRRRLGGIVALVRSRGITVAERTTDRVRLRVDPGAGRLRAWIDDDAVFDVDLTGREVDIRPEVYDCLPLGISAYATEARIGEVRWRRVTADE